MVAVWGRVDVMVMLVCWVVIVVVIVAVIFILAATGAMMYEVG